MRNADATRSLYHKGSDVLRSDDCAMEISIFLWKPWSLGSRMISALLEVTCQTMLSLEQVTQGHGRGKWEKEATRRSTAKGPPAGEARQGLLTPTGSGGTLLAHLIPSRKRGHHGRAPRLWDFGVHEEDVAPSYQCRSPGPTLRGPGICSMNKHSRMLAQNIWGPPLRKLWQSRMRIIILSNLDRQTSVSCFKVPCASVSQLKKWGE